MCHPTLKKCMECINNTDCAAKAPLTFCDLEARSGECVECLENSHCTAGAKNTGKCQLPIYNERRCDRCDSDQDCEDADLGRRCLLAHDTGRCKECFWDGDCVKGPGKTGRCEGEFFTCSGCYNDQDCRDAGLGLFCKLELDFSLRFPGRCVQCLKDEHCTKGDGDTGRCNWDHECLGCDTNEECDEALPSPPRPIRCSTAPL